MAQELQGIFIDPPLAIARLGGSTVPQDAFAWAEGLSPRAGDETRLMPRWTLDVQPDGSVMPRMPERLVFRDGSRIRPVCPYFELWALLGEPASDRSTWKALPLTPALLRTHGLTTADVVLRFDAVNAKAARRRNDPDLRFGTFPPLEIRANRLTPAKINGVSPLGVANPMIPAGNVIPLGTLQFIRSTPQPAPGKTPWANDVNVEILRFRFTPPAGHFYGPPMATEPRREGTRSFRAVPSRRAFLNPGAGWFGRPTLGLDAPSDTYDAISADQPLGQSLGVIDDTCDARITVTLLLPDRTERSARASLFVGPPDFAPDRRPFLTLADELNDRAAEAEDRSTALNDAERDLWIEDLFERAYETVSLMNVDHWRQEHAKTLTAAEMTNRIAGDGLDDDLAMGARDKLRNRLVAIPAVAPGLNPLPLSTHAKSRHRALSDLIELKRFIQTNPGRLKALIRPAFEVGTGEGSAGGGVITSMRMPPFMRQSNARPLTLSVWQYALLQTWLDGVESPMGVAAIRAATAPPKMSPAAERRLQEVLNRLDEGAP